MVSILLMVWSNNATILTGTAETPTIFNGNTTTLNWSINSASLNL
ncbi:hypothetical protein Q4Q39_15020 [Flavivirga amylovorans]|uniref:Uncharacterized protein n=1 Tax=Flavivirga amylovorans TaxID=870486 RepID=A0ABT8X4F9_9FLAO|nr:hypothetical protein [Flavivirga amylovorans]MDO5988722.1 hypothetical protein [Flavivirga amylovorans]